jgi:segregation and condensation protein B
MDDSERRRIVEAVILGSPEPISAQRVAAVIPYCKPAKVKALVEDLNAEYAEQGRSFEIGEIAGGYQVRTLPEFASYLLQIQPQRPLRLSKAALETLAIAAYRQPVTRAEIEDVRGVDSGAVVRGLLDRKLLRIAGHKEVPGRPMIFGTTRRFLEIFGLEKLEDLPSLRQLEDLAPRDGVAAGGADEERSETRADGEPETGFEASAEVQSALFEEAKPVGKPH